MFLPLWNNVDYSGQVWRETPPTEEEEEIEEEEEDEGRECQCCCRGGPAGDETVQ